MSILPSPVVEVADDAAASSAADNTNAPSEQNSTLPNGTAAKRRLTVRYSYAPALAPDGREFEPVMHIYLSQNVRPDGDLVKIDKFSPDELEFSSDDNKSKKLKDYFHGTVKTKDISPAAATAPSTATTTTTTTTQQADHIASKLKTKTNKKLKDEIKNNKSEDSQWYNQVRLNKEIQFDWKAENQVSRSKEMTDSSFVSNLQIDRDTTLNFYAFTYTYNNKGEKCLNEAGSCSIYVFELFFYLSKDPKKKLIVKKPMIVYNAENMFKGFIFIEFTPDMFQDLFPLLKNDQASVSLAEIPDIKPLSSSDVTENTNSVSNPQASSVVSPSSTSENTTNEAAAVAAIAPSVTPQLLSNIGEEEYQKVPLTQTDIFKSASEYDYMGDNKKLFDQVFIAYIAASYIVFDKNVSLPSWKFMSDIHSPAFLFNGAPTQWGEDVKYNSIVSPGICFTYLHKDLHNQNSPKYYLNLLMIVLRRHYKYKTLSEAMDYFINKESDEECGVILAKLICVFSNYCKYMTDKVQITFVKDLPPVSAANEFKYVDEVHDESIKLHHDENEKKNINKNLASSTKKDDSNSGTKNSFEEYFQRQEIEAHLNEFDPEYAKNVADILDNKEDVASSTEDITHSAADKINQEMFTKLIEAFSLWLRLTFTGDCEDMAREILCQIFDIQHGEFTHPGLQRLQQIRKKYVALQTLKGVSSTAIVDALKDSDEINAHMDITLMPVVYFLKLMRNFNSSIPLFEHAKDFFSLTKDDETKDWKVLVCEGTGCLNPDSTPSDSDVVKEYIQRGFSEAFADIHSMIYQDLTGGSSFYKTIQSALSNDLIEYGIGEIVFFKNANPYTVPAAAAEAAKNIQSSTSLIDTFQKTTSIFDKNGKFGIKGDLVEIFSEKDSQIGAEEKIVNSNNDENDSSGGATAVSDDDNSDTDSEHHHVGDVDETQNDHDIDIEGDGLSATDHYEDSDEEHNVFDSNSDNDDDNNDNDNEDSQSQESVETTDTDVNLKKQNASSSSSSSNTTAESQQSIEKEIRPNAYIREVNRKFQRQAKRQMKTVKSENEHFEDIPRIRRVRHTVFHHNDHIKTKNEKAKQIVDGNNNKKIEKKASKLQSSTNTRHSTRSLFVSFAFSGSGHSKVTKIVKSKLKTNGKIQSKIHKKSSTALQKATTLVGKSAKDFSNRPLGEDITDVSAFAVSADEMAKRPTYGIAHADLINKNTTSIMVYTMPTITLDELRRFRAVLKHSHPVPALDGPKYLADEWETSRKFDGNVLLERVCAISRMQKRHFDYITPIHMDYYIRDDQITKARCDLLITLVQVSAAAAADQKMYLLEVQYYPERLTKDYGGYLLRFVCAPVRASY